MPLLLTIFMVLLSNSLFGAQAPVQAAPGFFDQVRAGVAQGMRDRLGDDGIRALQVLAGVRAGVAAPLPMAPQQMTELFEQYRRAHSPLYGPLHQQANPVAPGARAAADLPPQVVSADPEYLAGLGCLVGGFAMGYMTRRHFAVVAAGMAASALTLLALESLRIVHVDWLVLSNYCGMRNDQPHDFRHLVLGVIDQIGNHKLEASASVVGFSLGILVAQLLIEREEAEKKKKQEAEVAAQKPGAEIILDPVFARVLASAPATTQPKILAGSIGQGLLQ